MISDREIRIAMLGMVEGNGHPYSWTAILNDYDRAEMAKCPFPSIPDYLGKEPPESLKIPGVRVTHIWTDSPADAHQVARATFIPNVVEKPEAVIGEVDAVVIATDRGYDHIERCRPFVEHGLPIFVDKPLVDNAADLAIIRRWIDNGAKIMSASCMRYCKEYMPYRGSAGSLGAFRFASITTNKSWERYGIHALEGIYPILGPGFLSARNTGAADRNIVHLKHKSGADVVAVATQDMSGSFGVLSLCGTLGFAQLAVSDFFYAFKAQLMAFVDYVRTGIRPYPFSETVELMQVLIAGLRSRAEGGREVSLDEISSG